jgi:hypothetical protein
LKNSSRLTLPEVVANIPEGVDSLLQPAQQHCKNKKIKIALVSKRTFNVFVPSCSQPTMKLVYMCCEVLEISTFE